MNVSEYDYAVIGGDLRQVYLAAELARAGHSVCQSALCRSPEQILQGLDANTIPTFSPEDACRSSSCVICPIPFSKDGIFLNQNRSKKNYPIQQFLLYLAPGQLFLAGCIPNEFSRTAREKNICCFDFMKDTALSHFNSIATAEGVLCEAIRLSPKNLQQSRCAVLGYGTCGRTITDKLKGMRCYVTVAAAPSLEISQAACFADQSLPLNAFFRQIREYDFIFNTIPATLLTKDILSRIRPDTAILDIASSPGGVDFAAAKELSLAAQACPGLPGKYAPLSSAQAILSSVSRIKSDFERSKTCL